MALSLRCACVWMCECCYFHASDDDDDENNDGDEGSVVRRDKVNA